MTLENSLILKLNDMTRARLKMKCPYSFPSENIGMKNRDYPPDLLPRIFLYTLGEKRNIQELVKILLISNLAVFKDHFINTPVS